MLVAIVAAIVFVADRITKVLVESKLPVGSSIDIAGPWIRISHVTNTGAAFGSFRGNNTFFVIISIIALVVVVTLLVRPRTPDRFRDLSLALLLAGILGNLTDRLLYGHVIDFLLFNLHVRYADPWPAFNVADSCISIAVVLFIIHSFSKQKSAG